jgi:hypothetical protein
VGECPEEGRCSHYKGKHHTLIHAPKAVKDNGLCGEESEKFIMSLKKKK